MNWNIFSRLGSLSMPIEFSSPLGAMRWVVLAGVPVGIIALYFLKLKRRPVNVSSTLLWRKSLEDLHVNSLFQRLRRNLLLFLQLLAVALAMLALAGPRIKGASGQGQRYVLLIDNSASMSATDVPPSRLAKAKEEARKVVRSMGGDDLAMVVSFAETARVVSNYTGDTRTLLQRIDSIEPTQFDNLAARGASGRGRAGQSFEADWRGNRRHAGAGHAQALCLHRRRVPGRRGLQPGQPRARSRGDRPSSASLCPSGRGRAGR